MDDTILLQYRKTILLGVTFMGKKERFYADIMSVHPEVTGSCNIVTVRLPYGEKFHFIVDCGLFQEEEYMRWNNELVFNPANIDFCLVTHAHADHIGRLPFLIKKGYNGLIYCTDVTKNIMPSALKDSAKVLRENAKRKSEKALYDDVDVKQTLQHVRGYSFNEWIHVRAHVDVMFLSNGHLYGAAMILVRISYPKEKDINILFTGDYNNKNIFFDLEPIPKWVYSLPLTIVQESTYGDMESSEIKEQFDTNILRYIDTRGSIIIPVFALGRMQEVLYYLKRLQENQLLPVDIPIYLDGKLGITYTMMCEEGLLGVNQEMRDFLPENIIVVDKTTRGAIMQANSCKIIVTTSGMGSHGPAQTYIPNYITRNNTLIQFTGYVTEGTLGREIKETPRGETVKIRGILYKKEADVEYTSEFSAHAKADEIISFLRRFEKPNLVLINHGEFHTKEIFATRVLDEVNPKKVGVLGRYFFRINPYGLVTSKSAKFL